jgi:predicted nucleotidyltransferase
MSNTDVRARFRRYLDELAAIARNRDDVVGLVAFGSTADRDRVDEWSDHDFAWITQPGAEDRYRHDLSWLPGHERIALSVVEHHGGVKVVYDDGRRLEFGIAAVDDFSSWAGAPAEVIVGDESVRRATEDVTARRPEGAVDAARELRLMLTQIHSGVGRTRRGETLSGSGLVRFEAVNHLARALAARLPGDTVRLDPLDPRRRFDLVHPEMAARLEAAVRQPIEEAARALVDLSEELLAAGWDEYPRAGVAAVRARMGWSAPA